MTALASDILTRCAAAGVRLEAAGDRIRLRADAQPPRELVELVKARKADLLPALQVEHWRSQVDRISAAGNPKVARLVTTTASFLDGPHLLEAQRAGWGELELFGVDPRAPFDQPGGWGLVPRLALSPLRLELVALEPGRATFRSAMGATLVQRVRACAGQIAWWQALGRPE